MKESPNTSTKASSGRSALQRLLPTGMTVSVKALNFLLIAAIFAASTVIFMGSSKWIPDTQIRILSPWGTTESLAERIRWRSSNSPDRGFDTITSSSTESRSAGGLSSNEDGNRGVTTHNAENVEQRVGSIRAEGVNALSPSREQLLLELTRGFSAEDRARLSGLGRVLFLQEPPPVERRRNFTIVVWQHGKRIERRLLRSYGNVTRAPLDQCPVQNCRVVYTKEAKDVDTADAALFHLQFLGKPEKLPTRTNLDNRWIFWSDESPRHAFTSRNVSGFNGVFNWSMAYRFDTDVPVPYGRTVLGPSPPVKHPQKTKLAAVLGSNCDSQRWRVVKELKKLMPLDTYGKCGDTPCPGHYDRDCELLNDYKFYLSFENSHCDGYITEKVFWQAAYKGAVPVVFGAPRTDYEKLLPPGSYIFAEDFGTAEQLADFLVNLSGNPEEYSKYHGWRDYFTVLNEHGYFGSPIHYYCRICEALNYNDGGKKEYPRVTQFWGATEHCTDPDANSLFRRKSK